MNSVTIRMEIESPIRDPQDAIRHAKRICANAYDHAHVDAHVEVIGYDPQFLETFPEKGNRVLVDVTVNENDEMEAIVKIVGPLTHVDAEYQESQGLGLAEEELPPSVVPEPTKQVVTVHIPLSKELYPFLETADHRLLLEAAIESVTSILWEIKRGARPANGHQQPCPCDSCKELNNA